MTKNYKRCTAGLRKSYSPAEAKEAIDRLLAKYGENCRIDFRKSDAEIIDSYRVRDIRVRRAVCEILARTGLTKRSGEDMSAEWRVHNVCYRLGIRREKAKDVSLDYDRDPRRSVRLAGRIFDKLNVE